MSTAVATRHTAEERREEILEAAVTRFGETGLHGTSTETIAQDVGVSQPYVFRLYGTKKQLFMAAVEWGFRETSEAFRLAALDATGSHDAFRRMGEAYNVLLEDRRFLDIQMQGYASCADAEIRELVQLGFGRLVMQIQAATEATPEQLASFLGRGMLMNVLLSMGVAGQETGWPAMVREGCLGGFNKVG
ncbi:MAG: TetR/AcrR family transcriptional regulator [Chloroflexota bacterium]